MAMSLGWSTETMQAFVRAHRATCAYCLRSGSEDRGPDGRPWTKDHVQARSRGGPDDIDNLVLCCQACNASKGARPAVLYREHLAATDGALPGMTLAQATALRRYVEQECYWLEVRIWPVRGDYVVSVRLLWPLGHEEIIREYRRGAADAAMGRLCAISDAYWATAS
jgi:hypothetical protein